MWHIFMDFRFLLLLPLSILQSVDILICTCMFVSVSQGSRTKAAPVWGVHKRGWQQGLLPAAPGRLAWRRGHCPYTHPPRSHALPGQPTGKCHSPVIFLLKSFTFITTCGRHAWRLPSVQHKAILPILKWSWLINTQDMQREGRLKFMPSPSRPNVLQQDNRPWSEVPCGTKNTTQINSQIKLTHNFISGLPLLREAILLVVCYFQKRKQSINLTFVHVAWNPWAPHWHVEWSIVAERNTLCAVTVPE